MPRGKQISFFMTREDEEMFVAFLFSTGDVRLVRDQWYETKEYEAYDDPQVFFDQPVLEERHKTSIWLIWNRTLCECDLVLRKVTGQPFYTIREDKNYVAEFTRCVIKNEAMDTGRLACLEGYEDDSGVYHKKSDSFMKWYRSLDRWITKRGVRASFDGVRGQQKLFILPGALEYYHQGGKLGSIAGKPGAFQPLKRDSADGRRTSSSGR